MFSPEMKFNCKSKFLSYLYFLQDNRADSDLVFCSVLFCSVPCRYMWQDSTLREVAQALREVVVPALASISVPVQNSKLDVSVVFMKGQEGPGRALVKHVSWDLVCLSILRHHVTCSLSTTYYTSVIIYVCCVFRAGGVCVPGSPGGEERRQRRRRRRQQRRGAGAAGRRGKDSAAAARAPRRPAGRGGAGRGTDTGTGQRSGLRVSCESSSDTRRRGEGRGEEEKGRPRAGRGRGRR
jgi:hypothetical protein